MEKKQQQQQDKGKGTVVVDGLQTSHPPMNMISTSSMDDLLKALDEDFNDINNTASMTKSYVQQIDDGLSSIVKDGEQSQQQQQLNCHRHEREYCSSDDDLKGVELCPRTRNSSSSSSSKSSCHDSQGIIKEFISEDVHGVRCQHRKRNRTARIHSLTEKKRRDKIKAKFEELQQLLPNCAKMDRAPMLDEAITYLKSLQQQVQVISGDGSHGIPPQVPYLHPISSIPFMVVPGFHAFLPAISSSMNMNINMNMGLGMRMAMPARSPSSRLPTVMPNQCMQFCPQPSTHVTTGDGFSSQADTHMQCSPTDPAQISENFSTKLA